MKKYLIAFLLSLSCVCAFAATGCGGDDNTSSNSGAGGAQVSCDVSFENGEGFSYVNEDGTKAENHEAMSGSNVTFKIDLGGFYLDSVPVVYANDEIVLPSTDGVYSVNVAGDTAIRVEGVKKDVSNMTGTGAFDDAFLVSKPIDLLYIAEQVNAGKTQYTTGAYILANDIDCKGEELKVIGDLSTDNSYFAGCFSKLFFKMNSLCHLVNKSYSIPLIKVEDGIKSTLLYTVGRTYPSKSFCSFIA